MKKPYNYIISVLAILLVIFLSLDIRKLDEYNASNTSVVFNAEEYALDFWNITLPGVIGNSPDIHGVVDLLESDPELAFKEYGNKLGISRMNYFMVSGNGMIKSVEEEFLLTDIGNGRKVRIATAFIFGNAVREGSGAVNINNFVNMTDFNNVSVAINDLVKERVVLSLKEDAREGMIIDFTGAFRINEEDIVLDSIRIIPVSAKLSNGIREN